MTKDKAEAKTLRVTAATAPPPNEPSIDAQTPKLRIMVEFSGGLEMLFADERRLPLEIPSFDGDGKPVTIAFLIDHLCRHEMRDSRKELFVLDDHIRPGILVLINETDWELEGEEAYEIQPGDNILFVSTLHGG